MAVFTEQLSQSGSWTPGEAVSADASYERSSTARVELTPQQNTRHGDRPAALLSRFVEAEILPRLALTLVGSAPPDDVTRGFASRSEEVAELTRLVLADDNAGGLRFVQALRQRGATIRSLYLGVLTDAARKLGDLWQDDRCTFVQVTISMGRLQQIVRSLSPDFQARAVKRARPLSALLIAAPGEQHTFGLVMLGEFFRASGWHVAGGPIASGRDAAEIVHETWFDVAGLSIGAEAGMDGLASCIRGIRRASRNRAIGVMIGGPLFLSHPDLVARVGADTGAQDAPGALRQARALLGLQIDGTK